MIIAHLHVWDKNNKGDLAIVQAAQAALRKRFPGCRLRDLPITFLRDATDRDLVKVNQADLVVIGGGGLFYSYFLPYDQTIIDKINKPIIIFGVGYIREVGAPALSRQAAASAAYLASRAAQIGVRDDRTKRFLIDNGIKASRISVIGDPAALLLEKKPKSAAALLGRSKKVFRVGLNLNYSGWLGFGNWRTEILEAYREAVDYLIKSNADEGREVRVYYLKHHPGEDNIYPELEIPGMTVIDLNPSEQKYIYGKLDLVIGMMLHAGVMAFGAGTPEISVAYDLRNHSFSEYIGCPELTVDLKSLKGGGLLKAVKKVMAGHSRYKDKFCRVKAEIAKNQEAFLDKAASCVI